MKKLILTHTLILVFGVMLLAQNFKYELVKDRDNPALMCVMAHPQFTDNTACLNGGDVVILTPISVQLKQNDVVNTLGSWSLVNEGGTFEDFNVYQFTSASISKNLKIEEGNILSLFCVSTDGSQRGVEKIRLLDQVDHFTPVNRYPDLEMYEAGARHTTAASHSADCLPSNGTIFAGVLKSSSLGENLPDLEEKPFEGISQDIGLDNNILLRNEEAGVYTLYPNPASTEIHINLPKLREYDVSEIVIYDGSGKSVYSRKLDPSTLYERIDLDQANIPTGIFMVQVLNDADEVVYQDKVIVQQPK